MRLLYRRLWLFGAGTVIVLAVLLSLARLLTGYATGYHGRIEERLGELVGQDIEIGKISAAWRGFGPRLQLDGIRLLDSETGRPLVSFAHGEIGLDLLVSLLRGEWYVDRLVVSGVGLTVVRAEDGGLTVAGIEMPAAPAGGPVAGADPLLSWLLAQGRLAVEDAEVTWIDLSRDTPAVLRFSDVSLDMRNSGARHRLTGSARLPALIGQRFSFAIDAHGDLPGLQGWDARAYVEGVSLRLGELPQGPGIGGLRLAGGDGGVSLWGEWKRGRLMRLEGSVSAHNLALERAPAEQAPAEQRRMSIEAVAGRFAWRRQERGWRVDVNDFVLTRAGRSWPASDFGLQYLRPAEGAAGGLRLHAGYLDLGDAAEFLVLGTLLSPRQAEALVQLDPRGRLRDLDLAIAGAMDSGSYSVQVRFENLTTSPWEKLPGVRGVDGVFAADEGGGNVELGASGVELLFPHLFRGALPVATLEGSVRWARDGDGWRVDAPRLSLRNADAEMEAWGGLAWRDAGMAPTLALFGAFQAASVENVSRYLPVGIMPAGTVSWLDRAIMGGTVPRGTLLFYGPLGAFPFDGGEGRFQVDFDVRNGVLDYADDWPPLDQIEANVVFDGSRMDIHAVDGRSLASMVGVADVRIENMRAHPAVLEVDGKIRGPTHDVLRYLRESPLRERFGAYVAGIQAQGDSRLDLRLAIPLNDPAATAVDGRLRFDDSRLATAGGGFDLAHVRGELRFTEDGLHARDIEAELLGLPARVDVQTEAADGGAETRVSASGRADVAALERWSRAPLLDRVRGTLPWRADLRVPGQAAGDSRAALAVVVDLTEAALDLPPPLAKEAGRPLSLQITAAVPHASGHPLRVQLGDVLSGVLELDDDLRLQRGELRLGDGDAVLPQGQGLRIAGRLERLVYADWAQVLAAGAAPAGEAAGDEWPHVSAIDLSAAAADFHGRVFHQARIAAERKPPGWELQVASVELEGRIEVPADRRLPWTMDLDRLHIPARGAEDDGSAADTDPRELPALRIRSQDFKYQETAFGSLDLAASRQVDGLRLDRLLLSSRHMRVDAKGDWRVTAAGQTSAFAIRFDSGDFGAALARLGYAGTVDDGKAQFDINARWNGPPTAFALEKLDGSLRMRIDAGRLLDVEPGAGRIFGLLSLQALPRRLSLDFSDFFRKGFSFDRIEGNFVIKDGNALTRDLTMDGPAAKIAVDGRIDLAARAYDQTVVVTPSVSSGLPVAGAVVGGVGVGAVMLLMERMLKPNIERLTRVTYRVTGSWNDPEIERLQDAQRPDNR